jgi:acetoin utilization protein AcuB
MRVIDFMHTKVFTVEEDDLIDRVFFLLHYEKIRHLPVVNRRGEVIGIVSDRDLYKSLGPKENSNLIEGRGDHTALHVVSHKVRHIMHRHVLTIGPNDKLSEAAAIMAKHRVGALPVVKSNKLVGIITSTDLLRILSKMDAALEQGDFQWAKEQESDVSPEGQQVAEG